MLDIWMNNNGIDAGSFHAAMLIAMCKADLNNQARIRQAFPRVGHDYDSFMNGESKSGGKSLQEIISKAEGGGGE